MKNLDGKLIIVFLAISFSFSTSFSEGLYAESLDASDVLALSEFMQDTETVYITINQVPPDEPDNAESTLFNTSSAEDSPVEINLENPVHSVESIVMDVCDEDDYLSLMSCNTTERTEGFFCRAFESGDGCCSVMLFSRTGSSLIAEGTGPIFTLQFVVSDEAPAGKCRALTTENAEATDANGFPLQVISSQGEYCFAVEVGPEDIDEDGTLDHEDNCPDKANPDQEDLDGDGDGDVCDDDIDGDGLPNDVDECPRSNPETDPDSENIIIIEDCELGIENYDLKNGCLMSVLIDQCAEEAENQSIFIHGRFVSCVARHTNEWKREGFITRKEKAEIQRCAARSKLPWIRFPWEEE